MAQSFFQVDPVEVTPGTASTWVNVDCSGWIPVGATGVILHAVNNDSANSHSIGARKAGSTDAHTAPLYRNSHAWHMIGVDANRRFQAYIGNVTQVDLFLVGYTTSGVTFFTNAYNKTSELGVWADVDCSAQAPGAVGLIFRVTSGEAALRAIGFRKKGSTDSRVASTWWHSCWGVAIGCDSNQVCQVYRGGTYVRADLIGYVTDGAVFHTDASNVTPGTSAAWVDLPGLPSGAVFGFIEVTWGSTDVAYGLRKNGSSEDIRKWPYRHPWAFVGCDESGSIEGWKSSGQNFHLVGYATGAEQPTWVPKIIVS